MNKWLKLSLNLFSVSFLSTVVTSCNSSSEPEPENDIHTKDEYDFTTVYKSGGKIIFDVYKENYPDECKKITFKINKSIGERNYLKIDLETDTDAVGWITYCDEDDQTKTNTEKFFVRAGDTQFTTFLDAYREGAFGKFDKKIIQTIAFQGVDTTKRGELTFKSLSTADKPYVTERMYIDDGTIKIGTSFRYGGSIEWLERIDINVIEYIDAGGNVRIDEDIDPSTIAENRLISSSVNMVNIYDYGREIQPSYYLQVDKEKNNYNPATAYNYDSLSGNFQYNPIQCGGVGDTATGIKTGAQIIDYEYKEDYIYIKSKGQDWMFVNDQAQGYIEIKYHFGTDGLLVVDNSYTDFYQFTNLNSVDNPMSGQETPATYIVYPLNYFYMQTKTRTINDPYLGAQDGKGNTIESPSDTLPSAGNYVYAIKSGYLKNNCDWMAFVNDQRFGCGIFMPNADYYIASRGDMSVTYTDRPNSSYNKLFYDFGDGLVPSYAASNYNYMNPSVRRRMIEYVPLEYQYALYIGEVSEMNEVFDDAKSNGLTNENLTMTTGTWPKH